MEKNEYHCTFDSELSDLPHPDTIIIRYTINNKFPAKLCIVNSIDKFHPNVQEEILKVISIKTPFHIKIGEINREEVDGLNDKITITEVLSNLTIDFWEYNKFCGFNNCILGCYDIPNDQELTIVLPKINLFLKAMNESLEQIVNVMS